MKLYSFQSEAVKKILNGFKSGKPQCLSWYTGAGKTNVFIAVCAEILKKNPNAKIGISAYLTKEIKEQVFARLDEFHLKASAHKIEYGVPIPDNKSIYVFNPQALHRREIKFKFDYLIIDESHIGLSSDSVMLRKILKAKCQKDVSLLLVSATPWDALSVKEFKDSLVYKRALDQGLKDGLITDFIFHAEEAKITFKEEDFSRRGDLGTTAMQRNIAILKSACIGKMKYLIKTYDKELGDKVLVICPPGNFSETARTLAVEFNGLAFLQNETAADFMDGMNQTQENLDIFRSDKTRFLFVTNKCQVGFDMKELSSVIDLTMTRNVSLLAQRCGRVARKNGDKKKNYFYVYDQGLMKDRLEWLIATMIDFTLGAYDGWTTKSVKYRRTKVLNSWQLKAPYAVSLVEIIEALSGDLIENQRSLSFIPKSGPPRNWSRDRALIAIKDFESRTDMWRMDPSLYRWFRLNAKDEMDRIFPLKNVAGKWHELSVIKAFKKCKTRKEAREKCKSALDWCKTNKRNDLKDLYLPPPLIKQFKYDDESILKLVKSLEFWTDVRKHSGARRWMHQNQGEAFWREKWEKVHGKKSGVHRVYRNKTKAV